MSHYRPIIPFATRSFSLCYHITNTHTTGTMLLSKWTLFSFVSTSLLLLNLPTAWANEKDGCPQRTLVLPDRTKYEQLCGLKVGKDNAKAKWPCFNAYYRDPSREYFPAHLNNALVTANKGIDPAKALIFSDGEFSGTFPPPPSLN